MEIWSKTFKGIILFFALTLVVSGCGESFRKVAFSPTENSEAQVSSQRDFSNSLTIERMILFNYRDEMQGREFQIRQLASLIKAFDLFIRIDDRSKGEMSIATRIVLGCGSAVSFGEQITKDELAKGRRVFVGRDRHFSVRIQCSNADCSEVVAAVSRLGGNNAATILIPLVYDRVSGSIIHYVGRNLELKPYYQAYHTARHYGGVNQCSFDDLPGFSSDGNDSNGDSSSFFERLLSTNPDDLLDLVLSEGGDYLKDNWKDLLDVDDDDVQDIVDDIQDSLGLDFDFDVNDILDF